MLSVVFCVQMPTGDVGSLCFLLYIDDAMKKSSLVWSFLLLLVVALGFYFWKSSSAASPREESPVAMETPMEVEEPAEESWFRYAPADTLYRRHRYGYFCFVSVYFEGDISAFAADNDSTLFLSPEVALSRFPLLSHKVPLSENTVSTMLPSGARMAVYRVDSVAQGARSLRYKLHRGF